MAGDMGDSGLIVASDVRNRRLALLSETIHASGATCVRIVRVGNEGALPFAPVFDRVLVDAPCSGLGTIRRDPDIRWRRSAADLTAMAHDQVALLSRAAEVVGRHGRLTYATCSSEPEENEGVVDAFLQQHANFRLFDLREGGPAAIAPFVDTRGMMRTLPFEHRLEAFFAAVLVRRAG
jgi:16S rRNA (cytosine967-C5)-methyltransferase